MGDGDSPIQGRSFDKGRGLHWQRDGLEMVGGSFMHDVLMDGGVRH